ncbi:MAG TPA: S1 RNA-binding domain-containing protein [Sandaracinaceae bacterium LLY-WYZ-13_1]|nr:S1 RNA-binding domain-containing protein [Sandaracinaceae bacterium LLY-WYZ-13_1]
MSNDQESFADLFAAESMPGGRAKRLSVGDEVDGVVAHVGADEVFVDLDAKQQGWFDKADLRDDEGQLRVKPGDPITGTVLAVERGSGQVKLGSSLGRDADAEQLAVAAEQGLPVEGKITGLNKGGAEVQIAGRRGFCPMSQLDARFVEDPESFVGQTWSFLVVELKDRDVVLSRRKLLERQAAAAREEVLETLKEGATLRGRVTQIRDFGAFVDLGGLDGLVPVRELSHDRVQRPEDVVGVGDVVEVKVLRLEQEKGRPKITLSLKALAADPWEGIDAVAPVGQVVAGQVTRLAEFGAFVRLAAGVEGLLHVSELGARVKHPGDQLEVGQQLLVAVRDVDRERKRISLALAAEGAREGEEAVDLRPVRGAVVTATVEKVEHFGVFVQVAGTRGREGRGLVPNAELGFDRGVDVRKELPLGTEIRAKVIDATEGKLRLSIRAAKEDAERAVYDSYRQSQAKKGGMGTLGDLLADKLEK